MSEESHRPFSCFLIEWGLLDFSHFEKSISQEIVAIEHKIRGD